MAQFNRLTVLQKMGETGLVPLFYHPDLEVCKNVMNACYQGGARTVEFTNRGDFAHEVFGELNKYCVSELPGLILGVGSVHDASTAAIYMQLGANFIVSASLREDIALICNRRKIPYMPGCATLTEIGKAEELGCEITKLFPGSVYGPGFIKAIRGPQPWTTIMPTGGVSPEKENLTKWFDAGAYCVGMGSKLIVKDQDGNFDLTRIEALTRESLDIILEIRG
jgi:2-dehydro-3-deoxyphosphogluconate aldolase/(4S)-4-hydroxy-2-oxoglutarate aldolase